MIERKKQTKHSKMVVKPLLTVTSFIVMLIGLDHKYMKLEGRFKTSIIHWHSVVTTYNAWSLLNNLH